MRFKAVDELNQLIAENNKGAKAVEKEKMTSSFFNLNGFFVCWEDKLGNLCHIFNQSKKETDFIFAELARDIEVEKFRVQNRVLTKLA